MRLDREPAVWWIAHGEWPLLSCNRVFSRALILLSEGPQADVKEATCSWTSQKKTKTQSTPTSDEHSSGKIAGGQEQVREEIDALDWDDDKTMEIDGLDWDDDKLVKEIDGCLQRLKDVPFVYYGGAIDDEDFIFHDEQQMKVLNQHLALCRIRAHEETYQDMDDATLLEEFPASDLEANGYYLHYELSYEWYFDPVYCKYVHFQDYQRLMLRNNGEYEDWEYYRRTCNMLEGDEDYVKFWEKLFSKSELIKWYTTRRTCELRFERLLHYHTLKTAELYPNVYKTLANSGGTEFRRSLVIDYIWSRPFADFFFEMWKLLTLDKLSFKDALEHLFNNDKYPFLFAITDEFEPNLRPLENMYKPFLDSICGKSTEDAKRAIKEYATGNTRKPKTYYDYAKKKLYIAEKIGLIPSATAKALCDEAVVTP